MLDSIQTKKSHLLNSNFCLATNNKQCKNIKCLCHSTSIVKLPIDDKFVYNATNCYNKLFYYLSIVGMERGGFSYVMDIASIFKNMTFVLGGG